MVWLLGVLKVRFSHLFGDNEFDTFKYDIMMHNLNALKSFKNLIIVIV